MLQLSRPHIWWTLLIASIVRKCSHLVVIQRSIQMFKAVVRQVLIHADVLIVMKINLHLGVSAVLHMWICCYSLWQQSTLVHIRPLLIDVLFSTRIEFNHHCAIHFGPSGTQVSSSSCIVEISHRQSWIRLSRLRSVLSHLLKKLLLVINEIHVLKLVVVICLFTA